MSSNRRKKPVPIHIHISTIFIGLFIVIAGITGWFNHHKTSEIFTLAAKGLVDEIGLDIKQQFKIAYRPVVTAVTILAKSDLMQAQTEADRLAHLPLLAEATKMRGQVAAFQVAYPDGDFFIVRFDNNKQLQKRFDTVTNTAFVVDHIDREGSSAILHRRFFSLDLQETQPLLRQASQYDPRTRPWYVTPSDQPFISKPYLFYFLKQVGVTISSANDKGAVIAADVTLEHMSTLLAERQTYSSTELLLTTEEGQVVAYDNIELKNNTTDRATLPKVSELEVPLLTELFKEGHFAHKAIEQEINGTLWVGESTWINIGNYKLLLTAIFPEQELLSTAHEIRQQGQIIQLAILLLALPIIWWVAQRISTPIRQLASEAKNIQSFDFSEGPVIHSSVREIHELAQSMTQMKNTISHYNSMIRSISAEKDFDTLISLVVNSTREISRAEFASIYLFDEDAHTLTVKLAQVHPANQDKTTDLTPLMSDIALAGDQQIPEVTQAITEKSTQLFSLSKHQLEKYAAPEALIALTHEHIDLACVPLIERGGSILGVLILGIGDDSPEHHFQGNWLGFIEALSGFSGMSLENRQLIKLQKELLESFIQLIASAIDAKSPYTGGHCQRVPELTKMLAKAACEDNSRFKDFDLTEDQWEELHFAGWLHDCGKVTTPEYVVDKATKLETLYDRIHEVRMRFEVLKRDAEIEALKAQINGGDPESLSKELACVLKQIDEDFLFIAQCNEGGEFMAEDKIQRLAQIAQQTWQRTLSDRVGISWEESQRKGQALEPPLPVSEPLLADKPEHIIERAEADHLPEDNPWGFKMPAPKHKYNRGELYNLSIARGTLAEEERYKINDHIVQTIIMLEQLPYPKHLRNVPTIAGGHHEKMDGTGYPKKLTQDEMPLTARMMAIADIFEALTASDRPYKKAKTLSEAIKIMSFMKKDQHIDGELFELFLTSGVYRQYAECFLDKDQIDNVDIEPYL